VTPSPLPARQLASRRRILVVGGVAAGASCAARLRRLDETCEIVLYDRGPFVSFANCGLPYYVGKIIDEEEKLLVSTPELFRQRFEIEVKVEHEVTAIDRQRREIEVRHAGRTTRERYDVLVLATGARSILPPLPGLDRPGVFTVRTIPDSRQLRRWIDERTARRATVIGGGFVGLEMVENLLHRGLQVSLIEADAQVMPPLDAEMVTLVHERLRQRGVALHLDDPLLSIDAAGDGRELLVRTRSGAAIPTDVAVLALGVRPETTLARAAGLELGATGGVRVDSYQRTSDPTIYAVGDAVEVRDAVTQTAQLVPLAGPANRQGRLAADAIAGRPRPFRGVQGTAVVGVLGLTVAFTGATEKSLRRAGLSHYGKVYLHPGNHVAYYPGAKPSTSRCSSIVTMVACWAPRRSARTAWTSAST
jgi:NADPH-dependent 2,4-dienoyl-CoA reductase/sulfur reductase-like enzyme